MLKWKSLREDPPAFDTTICIKIGAYKEVFDFIRYSEVGWGLMRDKRQFDSVQVPHHAMYIDLEQIPNEYGLQDPMPF